MPAQLLTTPYVIPTQHWSMQTRYQFPQTERWQQVTQPPFIENKRMDLCTYYGFINSVQFNCCICFRVNPPYETEDQILAATAKKRTDVHFSTEHNSRHHHRTKYIYIYIMEIWGHYSLQKVNHRRERDENFRIIAKSFATEAICNAQ